MPSDPIVWTPETDDGKVKHTFTGLRASFPNRAMHWVVMEGIVPFRVEMFSRPEKNTPAPWPEDLTTLAHMAIREIAEDMRRLADERSPDVVPPLADREQRLREFVDRANDPSVTVEALAKGPGATHTDRILQAADERIAQVEFDFTGKQDPDWAQPTPARVVNRPMRALIISLDRLIVAMSRSPSADYQRTFHRQDVARWVALLADLHLIVNEGGENKEPYYPTRITRSMLDGTYNADGSDDPLVTDGGSQAGEATRPPISATP